MKKNHNTFIFTDASKNKMEDGSAVGIAGWNKNNKFKFNYKLHDLNSIFAAEATTLLYTIKLVSNANMDKIYIFMDSKSVLKALYNRNKFRNQSYFVHNIINQLFECKQKGIDIELIWIPSYCGIAAEMKMRIKQLKKGH